MTLRTAVIGGGTVSSVHLDGLDRNPRTDLVAICDLDEDTARGIATEYDIQAFFDVEEMLAKLDLDWVHVCTPVQTHLPIAKTVIEAGIPVQIEKPITETYEEFEELASFAERHDAVVSEKHNHAFDPVVRQALRMKREGELGEVRGVDVIYTGSSRPDDPNRGPWNFDLAGGEFEEGIPHPIYITLRAGGIHAASRTSKPPPRSSAITTAPSTTTAHRSSTSRTTRCSARRRCSAGRVRCESSKSTDRRNRLPPICSRRRLSNTTATTSARAPRER